jgi:hypothetical protein
VADIMKPFAVKFRLSICSSVSFFCRCDNNLKKFQKSGPAYLMWYRGGDARAAAALMFLCGVSGVAAQVKDLPA